MGEEPSGPGILAGLRVVELSAFVAAPLAGMTLAALGADVIRIDRPEGGLDFHRWPVTRDGQSLYWTGLNKGKRSVAIDLTTPRGRDLATRLICAPGAGAGIVLTNLAGGWMSYQALSAQRADLIMVSILGNPDGSSAVDYTVNAATGFPFLTGPEDWDAPVNHVLPAWDGMTGFLAATGILAAERYRSRTGRGQLIRLALTDVAMSMVGHLGLLAEVQVEDRDRERIGNHLYGAFGRDFLTRDGRRLMVVALTAKQWEALCAATSLAPAFSAAGKTLGLELRREGDRYLAREALAAVLEPWISGRSLVEVGAAFDAHGVCWGRYQTVRELVETDPRCSTANPMFAEVYQRGVGTYLMPGSPLDFSDTARLPPQPAPALGEHSAEVLSEVLGLAQQDLARLTEAGIIGSRLG